MVFSCFCPRVSNSDETTEVKIHKKSWWRRFRAKKTVPVDSSLENDDAAAKQSIAKSKKNRKMTVKKAFLETKLKEKKRAENPKKSSICRAITLCKTDIQTDSIHNVPDRCQSNEITCSEEISSIVEPIPSPVISAVQNQQKKKEKKTYHKPDFMYGYIFLILVLVTMIFGGRVVATISLSASFYILPYFRTKKNVMYYDQRKGYNQTELDYLSSDQYSKKVVLQVHLERKRTK